MSGLSSGRISASNNIQNQSGESQKKIGWVHDIILDETHEYAKKSKLGNQLIGAIRFRTSQDISIGDKELPVAHPFDKNFKNLPIINEQVEIYEVDKGNYCYRRIGMDENPTVSAFGDAVSTYFAPSKERKQTSQDYQNVSITGITKTGNNNTDSKYKENFGKYYESQPGIHKLKLYEGDSLIESRFGQSIRFSGFNNVDNDFAPTIIIRNSENADNKKKDRTLSVEEDINKDGSVIVLSSGQHQLAFQPGTISDKGKSDFKTKPETFDAYPSKLIGDQILINSGRIILSAKNAEMIFYSKKNYGFISDGAMSIDNKLGIDVTVGDDINIMTNDSDVQFYTGKGSIYLGNENLEPLVLGQQLVDLLSELIDTIVNQSYLTPSGPSAVGPVNAADFGSIKSKLNNILSKVNQTS
jgi:hypothetical protein